MIFRDREDGGRQLAHALERYRAARPIVLGLTRGGVPVAEEVARSLGAALDVIVVRKIGAPRSPEYAVAAIAEGGAVYVRRDALREARLSEQEVAELAEREAVELARRVRIYRGGRPPLDLAGRTVIVVDDGVATGATAQAAARAARRRGASRVVLAAPVIAAASEPELRSEFDQIVAVQLPERFVAVGLWYERFGQVSDEEVIRSLRRARGAAWEGDAGEREWSGPDPAEAPAVDEETLAIPFDGSAGGPGVLDADLVLPPGATGLVVFVDGSGSARRSPPERLVARALQSAGLATLLLDLLTPAEAEEDEAETRRRYDLDAAAGRVVAATRWVRALPRTRALRLGYCGASTGAAAALAAAAALPEEVSALVSRGGRLDLVPAATLSKVQAPVLLLVGSEDDGILRPNRAALTHLRVAELAVVRGAAHLEGPGALEAVARIAGEWLTSRLAVASPLAPHPE
jgi:putative phosphoribosyl transferase